MLRLYGGDPDVLRERIRHVVLHEVAHHFGISDQRLLDMGATTARWSGGPSARRGATGRRRGAHARTRPRAWRRSP